MEKLRQLLAEQAESESLDYKSSCDLRRKSDQVELAKDIGAMRMLGGYIVVGADDHGRPVVAVTSDLADLFDEARLRARMKTWLPEPLNLITAVHEIEGSLLVLVYVGPSPLGLAVFRADGQYELNGKPTLVFRQGDVFARHGSASERWAESDLGPAFERVIEARKEDWRRGLSSDLARIGQNAAAQHLATGPASALTWQLDAGSFESVLVEQMRADDDIPLRLLLEGLPREATALAKSERGVHDLPTLFDRLVGVAALGLRLGRSTVFEQAFRAMSDVYDVGSTFDGKLSSSAIPAPAFWLELIERVLCLGALAVRLQSWEAVAVLARRPVQAGAYRWGSWTRHALTMAARSGLFKETADGREVDRSILSLAHRLLPDREALRPDLPPEDDRLLDSLCQFDALVAMAVAGEAREVSMRDFYPSFARFYTHRTEPVFARLVSDSAARQAIYPGSDADLAEALRVINQLAVRESFRYAGWDGFSDPRIRRFLERNPPQDQSP